MVCLASCEPHSATIAVALRGGEHCELATHHHRAGHRVLCAHTLGKFFRLRANLRLRHRVHGVQRPTVASLGQRAILKHLDFVRGDLGKLGSGFGGEHV